MCNQFQKFDENSQSCVSNCGQYASYINSSAYCQCFEGYYLVNGMCGKCQPN